MKDRPLSVQFLVAGGIVAFFSVISLILLLVQVSRQAEASRWVGHTHRAIGRLNTLGRDFYKQQSALLDYVKTGEERTLFTVYERRQFWQEGYKTLQGLVDGDPTQVDYLGHLDENYRAWLAIADRMIRTAKARGRLPLEQLRDESALFKQAFLVIEAMIDSENRRLSVQDREQKHAITVTFTAIAAINIVLLLVFGFVLTRLYFSIAQPIGHLSRGMARYQGGDFGARVQVSNRSEIGFLESSFNEMAEKIEGMVADLRKLDELKSEFLSTVSHELRTPLTSIGGYVKLLGTGDAGPVTETQKEFLEIVDTNVARLTILINDILDVEKMESGKIQLVKEPQDLAPILKEVRDTFGIVAQQKGLELRYRVPERLVPVQGDRMRLVQVFMNLVSNAIKYTKHGFVEIEAEEHDFAIIVRVRDSGVGLTPEEQDKLFQKFYRARSGLKSGEGGTGLGLVIVRGMVEAHGGTIRVESRPGHGTTFTVSFPVTQAVSRVAPVAELEGGVRAKPADVTPIWIVDQSASDVDRLKTLLERAQASLPTMRFEISTFRNVRDLPDRPGAAPRLVILDPVNVSDGDRAITVIRRKLHKTVPVLVVTAASDPASAFAEGASGWLTKPIDEREFLIAFKDLLHAKGWRVLVADPNTDHRILTKRALEQRGIHVDDVDHGSQVLGRVEQEEYDLALIALDFPDVSGREILKAIRRGSRAAAIPVLLMLDGGRQGPGEGELQAWGASGAIVRNRGISGIVESVVSYLEDGKPE